MIWINFKHLRVIRFLVGVRGPAGLIAPYVTRFALAIQKTLLKTLKNWPPPDSGKSLIDGRHLLRGICLCIPLFAGLVPHGRVIRDGQGFGQVRPSARKMQTRNRLIESEKYCWEKCPISKQRNGACVCSHVGQKTDTIIFISIFTLSFE